MLKKLFGNDETEKELVKAKESIEVLEERLRVKKNMLERLLMKTMNSEIPFRY